MGVSALLNTPDHLSKIVPHLIAFCKDANPQCECRKQTLLNLSQLKRRIDGLKRFLEMTVMAPKAIASDTKLMKAFIGRLNDINSKVSLERLDTYLASLGILSKMYSAESHLKAVLNQLVLGLMSQLSSKIEEHRTTAFTLFLRFSALTISATLT
ncbi:unnamed protein product [Cylicocyclus nassatus]|uniref:Uncharacterized protein n=1 Tax=Cylicocyclus nassatus TaxID=53992 RepID=A0AA36GNJ8_CYLNA|nr:unnamed protein product [Cylicocyclus nassatus]